MKKVILILLVFMLLGGGGAAYFMFFMKKPDPAAEAASAPVSPPPLLTMDNFKVPLGRDGRITRYGLMKLSLEMRGEAELKSATALEVRLREAIVLDLQEQALRQGSDAQALDLALLRKRVRMVANRVLKGEMVNDVLVDQWLDPKPS